MRLQHAGLARVTASSRAAEAVGRRPTHGSCEPNCSMGTSPCRRPHGDVRMWTSACGRQHVDIRKAVGSPDGTSACGRQQGCGGGGVLMDSSRLLFNLPGWAGWRAAGGENGTLNLRDGVCSRGFRPTSRTSQPIRELGMRACMCACVTLRRPDRRPLSADGFMRYSLLGLFFAASLPVSKLFPNQLAAVGTSGAAPLT